jgi:3-dehydroquinate synthase
MAYSATLAHSRGLLSSADHARMLNLFSRAGLSMDHAQFDAPLLEKATAAILKTRDGKLRAAVPVSPLGRCVFLNDVGPEEMAAALDAHKSFMRSYPRQGEGIDAYVDASDTGYTLQGAPVENARSGSSPLVDRESDFDEQDEIVTPPDIAGEITSGGDWGTVVLEDDVKEKVGENKGPINIVAVADGGGVM